MILIQIYFMVCILVLAGKDASSYRMKDHNSTDPIMLKRITRWHRDGVVLQALYAVPFIYTDFHNWYWYVIFSLVLRLTFFDIAFNKWAGLDYTHLGGTAWTDRIFSKIFGENGAVKKSWVSLGVLILLNLIKLFT